MLHCYSSICNNNNNNNKKDLSHRSSKQSIYSIIYSVSSNVTISALVPLFVFETLLRVVVLVLSLLPMSDASAAEQRWFPLESNPQLMNEYVAKLGLDTTKYQFWNVYSCQDWALDMVPQPVAAVILLYPLTQKQQAASKQQDQLVAAAEQLKKQQHLVYQTTHS